MTIHSSTVRLQQAAILKAKEHQLDPEALLRCYDRCSTAAEEIVNIMRMTSHFDTADVSHGDFQMEHTHLQILDEPIYLVQSVRCSSGLYCKFQAA